MRTVYAKNRPGKEVYPPNAKVEDLEYGVHKITIVHGSDTKTYCQTASEAK